MRLFRRLMLLFGLMFIIGGCSSYGSPDGAIGDGVMADGVMVDDVAVDGADVTASPLAQYLYLFDFFSLSPIEQQIREASDIQMRESFIAQCMNEKGFEYIPRPGPIQSSGIWRPEDRDWIELYGFGITVDPRWPEGQRSDPNDAIVEQLSSAERQARQTVLFGDSMQLNPDGSLPQEYRDNIGCLGLAMQYVDAYHGIDIANSAEFMPLMEALRRFRQDFSAVPTDAELDWSSCMADAGYPNLVRPVDAVNHFIFDISSPIINQVHNGWNWDIGEPSPANNEELANLQQFEIEIALADFDCRTATNFQSRHNAALFAAEAQFVSDHQAALRALRDAVEQRR